MAEQEGLDQLRGLVERRARSVPPPRRPRHIDDSAATPGQATSEPAPQPPIVEPDAEPRGSGVSEAAEEQPNMAQPPAAAAPVGNSPSVPSEIPREGAAEPLPVPAESPRPNDPPASATHIGPEPTANLTLRIRQSLDLRLVELLHGLRRDGVRSSKKELIEMCLSELPFEPGEQLRARLRAYRETVPKEPL